MYRSRTHMEVYKTIREVAGDDYPVLIKINGRDFLDNGLEPEDSIMAAKRLAHAGLDAIELNGGQFTSGKLDRLVKSPKTVMPVPDQVRDDGSGIQNLLKLLDSRFCGNEKNRCILTFK